MYGSVPATTPHIASWCPFRYLVPEWMTTSAPCSSGRKFTGLANVESTTRARPISFVRYEMGRMSSTRDVGLIGDSMKTARVSLRSRLRHPRGSNGSTSVTSMPLAVNSSVRSRCVPP
jgi:hypothetical protein